MKRKTFVVPDGPPEPRTEVVPVFAWDGERSTPGLRDTSKPVGYDSNGDPLYAPRGVVYRLPSP